MEALETREELEAQQMAEGKRHRALPMAIDVLPIHDHVGAVAEYAFDHRGDFRGRACLQLGIDARRFPLDMPIDHDTRAAVAHVPFGQQVLVPRPEVPRIGRTGRRPFTPDVGKADREDPVDHLRNGLTHLGFGDEAPPHIEQVAVWHARRAHTDPFQTGAGANPIQREQQAVLESRLVEALPGGGTAEGAGEGVLSTSHRKPPMRLKGVSVAIVL
jgi:hypothetical protein